MAGTRNRHHLPQLHRDKTVRSIIVDKFQLDTPWLSFASSFNLSSTSVNEDWVGCELKDGPGANFLRFVAGSDAASDLVLEGI